MGILIIGLGSIGKRHLMNCLTLGYNRIIVVSSKPVLPEPFNSIPVEGSLQDAFNKHDIDAAFICSPTAFHADHLLQLLRHKVPMIYVEKPVSHTSDQLDEIIALAATYPSRIVVGYDLHFDPGFQHTRQLLQHYTAGNILSVQAFVGQHLSQWRPAEDYRQGMSAKRSMGGGVLLDLVHELDYMITLAGDICAVCCNLAYGGGLDIETEVSADMLLSFANGVSGTLHLDYLQPQLKRFLVVTCTQGTITWNLAERYVECVRNGKSPEVFSYAQAERNDRFVEIVQRFLSGKNDDRFVGLTQSIKSLEVVLAAKQSAAEHKRVLVNSIV